MKIRMREGYRFHEKIDWEGVWKRIWESTLNFPVRNFQKKYFKILCIFVFMQSKIILEIFLGLSVTKIKRIVNKKISYVNSV